MTVANVTEALNLLRTGCVALRHGGFDGTVTDGKDVFVITPEMCSTFFVAFMSCAFEKGMRDADFGNSGAVA